MIRLHVSYKGIHDGKMCIRDNNQVHYLKDVLRVKPGEKIMLFDEKGDEYASEIKDLLPESIILSVKSVPARSRLGNLGLTIACAIPKKSKMDDIVDKLTQLGVDRIIPMETERVVVKLDRDKKILKVKRWRKIAESASLQSQRNTIPVIEGVQDIKTVLGNSSPYDLKLIPALEGNRKHLKDILSRLKPRNVLIFIGPEGDFTCEEIKLAQNYGCIPVTLGDLVLRVETAAVAVASFIRLYAF
ncbi:MAG: RsmE family RNA methyltransferase [Candidatus Omnitrophota bacterium]